MLTVALMLLPPVVGKTLALPVVEVVQVPLVATAGRRSVTVPPTSALGPVFVTMIV